MDSYTLEFSVCSKVITKCIHYKPLREKKIFLINIFASTIFILNGCSNTNFRSKLVLGNGRVTFRLSKKKVIIYFMQCKKKLCKILLKFPGHLFSVLGLYINICQQSIPLCNENCSKNIILYETSGKENVPLLVLVQSCYFIIISSILSHYPPNSQVFSGLSV